MSLSGDMEATMKQPSVKFVILTDVALTGRYVMTSLRGRSFEF